MNRQNQLLFVILLMAVCISGCSRQSAHSEAEEAAPTTAEPAVTDSAPEAADTAEEPQSGNDVSASDDADLTRSVMHSTLARRIPEEEAKTYNDYFSQIREETLLAADDPWGDFVSYVRKSDGMLCLRHSGNSKMELSYSLRASQNVYTSHTLRKIYCASEDQATLMQVDPISGAAIELYRSEGKLDSIYCGRNIVVFTEESLDGTWHVLRLYEPDGTVDVIEENLSEVAEIKIISNCEFVTMWKNPAYQTVEDANVAAIWADWTQEDEPYPGREEADRISNFHEVLPEDVFDRTGVFNYYSRYRNTLSGKTVTVGCIVGCAPLHDYCLLDGTPWTLSNERLYADWEKYDMPRFWLYLPADQ